MPHPSAPECGQNSRPFVPTDMDKTRGEGFDSDWDKTILSSNQTHKSSKHDINGTMNLQICGQKDKTGQNLKEKVKEKEKEKYSFSGCAANIDESDKTRTQDFCPTWDKTPQHDICLDKNGQNPTTEFCPNNGTKPQLTFVPPIISRMEAEELVATSRENLYISGNKVLCEDDDREWLIL